MLELRPIVVDSNMVVLGGNMRLKACIAAGLKEVPIIVADNLTEQQQAEFIIKDNVGFGEWDWDLLANQWDVEALEDWGLELPFDNTPVLEAEEDDYEAPSEIQTDIVLGDLIEIGQHRLLCGDSTDSDQVARLMNGEKADMVFTDPPYGMAYESNAWDSKKKEVREKRTDTQILNDESTSVGKDALSLIPIFLNNDRHFYIWCRWDCFTDFKECAESIGKIKSVIVWDKGGPGLGDLKGSYGDSEWAIFGMIGRRELKERQNGVWQVNRMKGLQMQHPTQKPLEICERGINNSTNINELILDLFLGSGSTMVAAHQLNRKCYGMELDPKYCQVIIDRMQKLDPSLDIKINGKPYGQN
jgi:site-specific DNA-methyltransferase (adenine-specific)